MQADSIERDIQVHIPVAIAKGGIDAARRTVRGLMSQEVVDSHGEEVDYESVKACLATWRGNVREMHQPKAVGRAVDIVLRDDVKAVEVESYVSTGAEDTWQKCLDGTLGYYSIGGIGDRVYGIRSDGTRGPRLMMKKIGELSLVDSGACPTSTISVVKVVDGEPVAQLAPGVKSTDEPSDTPAVTTATTVGGNDAGHALALGILKGMGFRSERWNITNALSVLALLEDIVTEQCYETACDSEAPDNAAQVELLRLAVTIVIDFIATEFDQQFAGEAMAKLADADRAAVSAIVEKAGARNSKGDFVMLQAMHDNCVKLGAACGAEKMDTKTTPETVVDAPVTETPAAVVLDAPVVAPVVEKSTDAPVDGLIDGVPVTTTTFPDVTELITKAIDGVTSTFTAQIAELKATSDATIEKLQDRVEKLSAEPQSGGPVANAHAAIVIEKGSQQMADLLGDRGVAEQVIAKLEEVAKAETDPHARQSLVEKSMALRMQHGIGAVHVPIPSQR